jgi:oxygen-dependent protoporphyrinogen oxidase
MKRIAVLGGGIAGLSAAWELERSAPAADIVLLEGSPRIGGLVHTEHTADGFLLEHGPDALLTRKPVTQELLAGLDLSAELLRSSDGPRKTYVFRRNRLVPLPDGLVGMAPSAMLPVINSPLLSPLAKLRLAYEPWVRCKEDEADETVASFVARRFGQGFLHGIVQPILEGVYGEGATQLSARALLPTLVQGEEAYGSITRMFVASRGSRPDHALHQASFVTPRHGMKRVVTAMAARLRLHARTNSRVQRIRRVQQALELELADGARTRVDGVVLAVPAHQAARLLESIDEDLSSALGDVSHTDLQLVNLGFARESIVHSLDGTGFVVAGAERRAMRACTWASEKWAMRAPSGSVLLRCFMHLPAATETELVQAALSDLRDALGIVATPTLTRVRMRKAVLPRPTVGHAERAAWIRERCNHLRNVQLAGGALGTVGVPDCAKTGVEAARNLLRGLV